MNTPVPIAKIHQKGFTLIELLVVIAIVAVISTLVLARYGQFNGQVLLRNLAYDIGLTVRQAQVFGISGKVGTTNGGVQYGVYFNQATPTQYTIFADNNGNEAYDAAAGESTEVFTVRQGYLIADFCGDLATGGAQCASTNAITELTIMFKRPDPDARISTNAGAYGTYSQARIYAQSPTGDTRTVTVTLTGQIAIQQSSN